MHRVISMSVVIVVLIIVVIYAYEYYSPLAFKIQNFSQKFHRTKLYHRRCLNASSEREKEREKEREFLRVLFFPLQRFVNNCCF